MNPILLWLMLFLPVPTSCTYNPELQRGDKVRIVDCFEEACWYRGCTEVSFLAGQSLDRVNVVWLLVKGCPWYQYPELDRATTMDVVTMRSTDIEKIK